MSNCQKASNRSKSSISKFLHKISKIFCKNNPIVTCVHLSGVIGKDSKLASGLNIKNAEPLLKKAFETKNTKAVAITINSPGGSPVQSELIHDYIRELAKEKNLPVLTFAQDVAASGGYWLLLSGDEIYTHKSSIIGSIGVIFSGFGFVDAIKKLGVERRVYAEGKNKAILDPFLPEQDENVTILKEAQSDIFEGFKEFVRSKRGAKLKESEDKLFTGAFWSGKRAVELGLVDGVANFRSKLKEKFGEKVEIIEITEKKSWLKSFFSEKISFSSNGIKDLIGAVEERISFNKFGL